MSNTRFVVLRLDFPEKAGRDPQELNRNVDQFLDAVGAMADYAGHFGGTLAAVPVGHPSEQQVEALVEELWNGD